MKKPCKMIYEMGHAEIIEKKSRFIADIYNIENEDQVTSYLNAIKKQYWDAKHHCFAYVFGELNQIQRCSDDGEPAGTAGKPILDVIISNELNNCLIIVTRYFGGTLLGTGGLVRAYGLSAKEGLNNCRIITKQYGIKFKISVDYSTLGKIQNISMSMNIDILHIEYSDKVEITLIVPMEKLIGLEQKIVDVTAAKAVIEHMDEVYFANENGQLIIL